MNTSACAWVAALVLCLSGCGTFPVGFEERDRYVVTAPLYSDGRIFYACDMNAGSNARRPLSRDFQVYGKVNGGDDSCGSAQSQFNNGDDISILISQVRLDGDIDWKAGLGGQARKDIAVVVNFDAKAGQPSEPIIVWYERGVTPGRVLSFANLHVYTQSNWDARVPPYFRLRVIDVTSERNAEVRAFFEQSSGIYSLISTAMGSPLSAPLKQMISRAGQLALTGKGNQVLMDYTFQLYPAEQMGRVKGTTLPPFYSGTYYLLGRKRESSADLWRKSFFLDELTAEMVYGEGSAFPAYAAPYVKVVAMRANYTVLGIVEERSRYLTALLRDSGRKDRQLAVESAKLLYQSVQLYDKVENALQKKNVAALIELVDAGKGLDAGSQDEILRIVGGLPHSNRCVFASLDDARAFLVKNRSEDLKIEAGKLQFNNNDIDCE